MTQFFNRRGEKLADVIQWATLFEDDQYRILRKDDVGHQCVSTIWLGFDQSLSFHEVETAVRIFETVLMHNGEVVYKVYSDTEEEAFEAHAALTSKLRREQMNG